jgi:tRNA-dihydrouridine synthase
MNLYFAPFHGITTHTFRKVFFSHFGGIDVALTPFLPAGESFTLSEARFGDAFPINIEPIPLIIQIIGSKPKDMLDTVLYLQEKGHERINWNIACPMPQITRKKRGCGLMPYPEDIEKIVESVCEKTSAKFSIKMRLGMYNPDESLEIINRLNNYPLDFIAIHARLGTQLYSGDTDKESFEKCFQQSKNQLCYNGDIFSLGDFHALQNLFHNLKACMLGRGLLRNPFLAEQIQGKEIPEEEQQKRFLAFYDDLMNTYLDIFPKRRALNRLKELWHYFAAFYNLSDLQLRSLLQITDCEQFIKQTNVIMRIKG